MISEVLLDFAKARQFRAALDSLKRHFVVSSRHPSPLQQLHDFTAS